MKKRSLVFVVLLLACFITTGFKKLSSEPQTVYRIYLEGKSLGIIKSDKELESYIDKKQQHLKKKYDVDKIYAPDTLDVKKEITYNEDLSSVKEIYEKIEDKAPFTIDGYAIKIKGVKQNVNEGKSKKSKDQIIYVLDKKVFKDAVDNTVKSFIDQDKYKQYKENNQPEIKDTGSIIESVYIQNNISIKKQKIPINKKIYMDTVALSKYLLFGTTKEQQKYTVQDGDTISDISFNNKISTEEFLIANDSFRNTNALLYPGEEVTIGILNPQFNLVEEDHTVVKEEKNFETETTYDNSKPIGSVDVTQKGVKGENRVTQKIQKINGEIVNIVPVTTEVITEPIKEIIVKGGKESNYTGGGYGSVVATSGQWGWPASCSSISSGFGYRWGSLHDGMDIRGCGYGSNIFAAGDGTVVESGVGFIWGIGEGVVIKHPNGYYTMYAHMCSGCRRVATGAHVVKGQVIGGMGQTGNAYGVHLHFSLWTGYPYRGGQPINPMSLY